MHKKIISEIMFDEAIKIVATKYTEEIISLYGDISKGDLCKKVQEDWGFIVRAANKIVFAGTMVIANKLD